VAEVVRRAQAQEEAAFLELVERYHVPARRVAQTVLGNAQDAEDAVQDAWMVALRKLNTLREAANFGAWFYRIVANMALRKRASALPIPVDLMTLAESVAQPSQDAASTANQLESLPLAMVALSHKDYWVTSLYYFSDVPIAVIAQLLEIPQGTVKSRLHHARQVMRKELLKMTKDEVKREEHIPGDFRHVISGMQGKIPWQKAFTGDFAGWSADRVPLAQGTTPDRWQVVGNDGVAAEVFDGGTRLTYGDAGWKDVELSLLMTPLSGGNAQLLFRVDESAKRFYMLDMLMGWQAIAISRVESDQADNPHLVKLSVVNYPLEHQREYAVSVAVRDHSITSYVDGALVNQVTDGAWLHGQIGLNVWYAKTLFRDIRVRLL
jgi:RNA polymerase sigma-70 factor (ECF subfamily)